MADSKEAQFQQDITTAMIAQGKTRFAVDFKSCASMDSTFLGVLAGAAIQLRRLTAPGSLTLLFSGAAMIASFGSVLNPTSPIGSTMCANALQMNITMPPTIAAISIRISGLNK